MSDKVKGEGDSNMERKGLCSTCIHDKDCNFPRDLPVWQCEEFSSYEPKTIKTGKIKRVRQRVK
jgi:hypothetical protein